MAVPNFRPPIRPDLPVAGLGGAISAGGLSTIPGISTAGPPKGGSTIGVNSFTPYVPPPIPSGYSDPALDDQRGAASRGLQNLEQDIGLGGRRAAEDYGLDPHDPTYGYSQVGTIERNYGRDTQDLGTARTNEGVDYGRNVAALTRGYSQLGRQQAEQSRKYGVSSGGIALLSAAKRDENERIDREGIDLTHTRAVQGFDTAGSRLGEDRGLALGQAGTVYNRGVADRGTALSRGRTEDLFYGLGVDEQKKYQAQQAGYEAPSGPSNQFTKPDGSVVQVVLRTENGVRYRYEYAPDGHVVSKKKAT